MLDKMGIDTDPEQIFRFVNAALSLPYKSPTPEETKAAAGFLFELIQAGKYHGAKDREIEKRFRNKLGVKKRSVANRLDPALVTLESPEFALVMRLIRKELEDHEVYEKIAKLYSVTPGTAERFVDKIRPRVRQQMKVFDSLLNLPNKKE